MNEGSGNKVFDLSGNGNDLLITSGAAWVPGGLDFSGAIQVESTAGKNLPATKGTIIITLQHDSWTSAGAFIDLNDGSSSDRIAFYTSADNLFLYIRGSDSGANVWDLDNPENTFTDGVTYTLAVTFDSIADIYKIYADGVEITPTNPTGSAPNPVGINKINLGTYYNLDADFDGRILDCSVYNHVLTASEIQNHYINPYAMFEPEPIYLFAQSGAGGEEEEQAVAGEMPAASGSLSTKIKFQTGVVGSMPAPSGALTKKVGVSMAGEMPASAGALARSISLNIAGDMPTAQGALLKKISATLLAGAMPAASGDLQSGWHTTKDDLVGSMPAASGALSSEKNPTIGVKLLKIIGMSLKKLIGG